MEKLLMKGDKNDLRCDENHQNSVALFLQINSKNEEQNKLLCFQCLEKLNSISNLISVDALIEQIKSKQEQHFDTRKEILTLIIDQLVEVDNQVEQVFKILHENMSEWKNQIQGIINQPIQFDLKQEILLVSDQKYLINNMNDSISQIHTHFVDSIAEKLIKLNEILKLTKIKEIYKKINFQYEKIDFATFPKDIEQINEISTGKKCISSIEFNFDNTLLFLGQGQWVVSFSLKSARQKVIVNEHLLPKIAPSKNKNLIVVSSNKNCSLWYCEKSLKWNKFGEFTDNNDISSIYLNQDDTQIIVQTSIYCVSIVQINYEKKTLFKIQQISNCVICRMNQLNSKILICQKACFLIYKQQQDNNQWQVIDKISLNQKETIIDATFIQNDDIIIQYKTENSIKTIMHYAQNQLLRLQTKNAFFQIDQKQNLFFPIAYNKQRQLYLQEFQSRINFIIMQNSNFSAGERAIYFTGNHIFVQWSIDGKIIVVGDPSSFKVKIYSLVYH